MNRRRLVVAGIALLLALAQAPAPAQTDIRFTMEIVAALTLEGAGGESCAGAHGSAATINDAGIVAGGYASSEKRMAPWMGIEGERIRLEGGSGGGVVLGINDAGDVSGVAFAQVRVDRCQYPSDGQPATWHERQLELLSLPDGAVGGAAWDIDDAGNVVGTVDLVTGSVLPVIWSSGGVTPLVLPALAGGSATGGEAFAINGLGVVAGSVERFVQGSALESAAVTWSDGIAQTLPTLGGGVVNRAWAVNDAGVAVGASCENGSGLAVAAQWRNGLIEALPSLPDTIESEARAINNRGQIAGFAWFDNDRTAVLWENGQVFDLNETVTDLQGMRLLRADAINEAGAIAAVAQDVEGYRWAVVLTPV